MGRLILEDLTQKEFTSLVGQAVKTAIVNELAEKTPPEEDLLTREKTAKLLDVDLSTIHAWVNKGYLTAHAIGHRRYFKKCEVMESLIELKRGKS